MSEQAKKILPLRAEPVPAADGDKMIIMMTKDELRNLIADVVRETANHKENEGLIDIEDAARFLRQSTTYVYRNWREMGGRKLGKNLRFTRAGLQKWIGSKGA